MRKPQEPRDAVGGHLDEEAVSECAFSPEQAAPGWLEHAAGCAECSDRIEELGRLLASLAELPEPEIPVSVLIRLDASVEQAWQEADAEAERKARSERRRPRTKLRERLAVSITALGVLGGAVGGLGYLAHHGSTGNSSVASSSSGGTVPHAAQAGSNLTLLAKQALESTADGATYGKAGSAASVATAPAPSSTNGIQSSRSGLRPMANCFHAPARAGFTVAAVAAEMLPGGEDSLVVYRNNEEPASATTFYAVLYAGPCPSSSSPVLDEGVVSVSR